MTDLIIRDHRIGEDANGNLNLTDVWRAAGSPSTKKPAQWRQLPTTDEYIAAVARNVGKSYNKRKNDAKSVIYSKTGKGGGTFGHILVAIGYGEYLQPDLAVEIKTTYLRVRTGDLTIVDEVLEKADAAKNFTATRDVAKQARKLFEDTLVGHGVASGWQMGYVTNAIYQVLLGGKRADVAKARNLPTKNFRDNLTLEENIQTMGTEVMASGRIKDEDRSGHVECYEATARAASFIKEAFDKERADRKPKE